MHGWFSGALKPYIGQARSRSVTVMWFVMPLIVYFHQHVIMKGSARRLFLEPLNDRGQLDRPSESWTGGLRRRVDVLVVAPWSVILAGPVLDCLFWLILKGSEGTQTTIHSKEQLIVATLTVSYWYLFIGTKQCKLTTWYYFFVTMVFFAAALHKLTTSGLTAYGLLPYLALFFNIWCFTWAVKHLRQDRKP
jgi:multidrug transporter EmrE-like cation transporter